MKDTRRMLEDEKDSLCMKTIEIHVQLIETKC